MHVASRTGSHAFPRDLRGSHPRHYGGDGEEVENGLAPGEGYAAEREGNGKSEMIDFVFLKFEVAYPKSYMTILHL